MKTAWREFGVDRHAVMTASIRRLLLRVVVVALLVALFGAAVNAWVPERTRMMAWSFAALLIAVYAAVEMSSLQWARRAAPTMVLRLRADAIEMWIGTACHRLPYAQLSLQRVRYHGGGSSGAVRSLELRSAEGGRVVIAGFQDMDELARALTAAIAEARADRA
ncbi:MAG: hypothetical protein K0Q76_3917 [Panacagrimonas sp.]|jgi:hypothetical protein|nr:hypothetical protein [Panacagrimonas sp.]MCC2658809.1 hypothetical protein [Panacagrimonas sp.]